MAKSDTPLDTAAPPDAAAETEYPVTLTEFCQRLSATDKRVELIAAFHHDEDAAGRRSDLEGAYRARLGAFINRPV